MKFLFKFLQNHFTPDMWQNRSDIKRLKHDAVPGYAVHDELIGKFSFEQNTLILYILLFTNKYCSNLCVN